MGPKCELASKVAAGTPFGRGGIQPLEDTVENLKIPFTYNLRLRPATFKSFWAWAGGDDAALHICESEGTWPHPQPTGSVKFGKWQGRKGSDEQRK